MSDSEGPASSLHHSDGEVSRLEAEIASLRAALAEREAQIDVLQASALVGLQIRAVADALPVLISYV
jgi:hypothetical protein